MQGEAYRVTIYASEGDHYRGKPLYLALLEMLRHEGASGATATRGLASFGAHSRCLHTASLTDLLRRPAHHHRMGGRTGGDRAHPARSAHNGG